MEECVHGPEVGQNIIAAQVRIWQDRRAVSGDDPPPAGRDGVKGLVRGKRRRHVNPEIEALPTKSRRSLTAAKRLFKEGDYDFAAL